MSPKSAPQFQLSFVCMVGIGIHHSEWREVAVDLGGDIPFEYSRIAALFLFPALFIYFSYLIRTILTYRKGLDKWIACKGKVKNISVKYSGPDKYMTGFELAYSYQYDGKSYTGNRIDVIDNIPMNSRPRIISRSRLESLLKSYEMDEEIEVWINPEHPEQAQLNNSQFGGWLFFSSVAVVISLLGMVYFTASFWL